MFQNIDSRFDHLTKLISAGTWGSATFGPPAVCSMPQTTTKECYDMGPKFAAAEMEKNKFAKFVRIPISVLCGVHEVACCLVSTNGLALLSCPLSLRQP